MPKRRVRIQITSKNKRHETDKNSYVQQWVHAARKLGGKLKALTTIPYEQLQLLCMGIARKRTNLVPGQPGLPRQQVLIGVARVPAERIGGTTNHERQREHNKHTVRTVAVAAHRKGPVLKLHYDELAAHYLLPLVATAAA
jgi:hypothetical protein